MYCNKCGAKQPKDAAYCPSCGNRLGAGEPEKAAVDLRKKKTEPAAKPVETALPSVLLSGGESAPKNGYRYPEPKPAFFARNGSWFALVVLIVLIAGGLYGWNHYKNGIVEQAAELRAEAEAFALTGDYSAARGSLQQASSLIRSDVSIESELEYVAIAERVRDELRQVREQLEAGRLDDAESLILKAEAELDEREATLLKREQAALSTQRDALSVLRMKQEASGYDNVTALAPLLEKVEQIHTAEAEEARLAIVKQIVDISSRQAEELLADQSFASAFKAVEQGLNYAPADTGLLALNGQIESSEAEAENRRKTEEAEAAEAERLAEAEANRRVEQAEAQEQAEYAVQSFYGSISLQDYGGAYAWLGSSWQKGTAYSDFAGGYDNTYDVWIDSIDSARNDDNVEVTVFLTAWESAETGMVYSTYRSVYQVGYENGTMKILSGKGEKLS